ncbi:hydantoinase/oxoprolinase family protein [Undibacter mobilis]|uniref:Hydantoinase/oxoprolinase family protein n=1 Tax=Undibacter mobilis TaxID=2292256 RepID=A0A371BAD0_9BRAD|nr:hydantoinase/oxoprolinase family protein [Undibacter mobilis]RDV04301.1 hydantoinase/oxoprolinase family protein [Undibacter mobilis]
MKLATRIAADIGGTFTDVAVFDEQTGQIKLGKCLSTPDRLIDGIQTGVDEAQGEWKSANLFLHGSTVAINTMLERTGARVALFTTEGFRDIYEIGRINRPDSFNLFFRKHVPLIERALRFEVPERLMADGSVHKPLDMSAVAALADRCEELGVEAIAILFLHSYRNPDHEIKVRDYLAARFPNMFISASHELSQEYREFERTSTVAANAYVGPRVRNYLGKIDDVLKEQSFSGRFMVVQSTGGLYTAADARRDCVRMMESGPAAGIVGTQALCEQIGLSHAISFDMGGTTAKSGVVRDGRVLTSGGAMIGGYAQGLPLLTEMVDIHEVGTGGGSIARVVAGGALRLGPQSAGAVPGPACYGRGGTQPTVTDANLLLGRLSAERFLGGTMPLDQQRAEAVMNDNVAKPLGIDAVQASMGIIEIATANMSHAVRGVTTERGLDPASFPALVAYGGAGPLHAVMVARELRIPKVIVPRSPGHFSAFGMLLSDLRYDFVRTTFVELEHVTFDELEASYAEMEQQGEALIARSGVAAQRIVTSRAMDMRYVGQEHAVTVDIPDAIFAAKDTKGLKEHFDRQHEQRYGRGAVDEKAEIISLRCTVTGAVAKPSLQGLSAGDKTPPSGATRPPRPVYFASTGWVNRCPVYDRDLMLAGNVVAGPALIEEHASTTVLQPGDTLTVDQLGNLVIEIGR